MLNLMLTFPKHTKSDFFQLYQKYKFLHPEILSGKFCIFGCGTEPSSTNNWSFLGKMAGKDKKVTFCHISISYLNIEIRLF